MYDSIIIGAGFSGSVIARILAENGWKVLIIEKRKHIAGNAYDEKNEAGILVQKYGPHIFHTNNRSVYEFITRYCEWNPYNLKCEVFMEGKSTPSPFNFKTIDQFYLEDDGKNLKDEIRKEFPDREKATIVEMLKSKNILIKQYADFLFEKDYSLYTAKQWGISPDDIDISVLERVPVRFDYKEKYFDDKFQCLPENGYTNFFSKLLNHENIEIKLGQNALEDISISNDRILFNSEEIDIPIVYTGAIDELYGLRYGKLPYRSLIFEYETKRMNSFQNAPVVAYPQAEKYTRITEYTKLPYQDAKGMTTIAIEYPIQFEHESSNDPYYPIINKKNTSLYKKYLKESNEVENLYLCGRLADYKYYNMDEVINRAIEVAAKIIESR